MWSNNHRSMQIISLIKSTCYKTHRKLLLFKLYRWIDPRHTHGKRPMKYLNIWAKTINQLWKPCFHRMESPKQFSGDKLISLATLLLYQIALLLYLYKGDEWTCDVYECPKRIRVSFVLFRFGADPMPRDGGSSPVVAILDKLLESPGRRYLYQLVSCLNILLSCITLIDMPYRVKSLF